MSPILPNAGGGGGGGGGGGQVFRKVNVMVIYGSVVASCGFKL